MTKVSIVGTGFVGRAWAISFARAGHEATLWDAAPSAPGAALAYIEGLLPDLAELMPVAPALMDRLVSEFASTAATLSTPQAYWIGFNGWMRRARRGDRCCVGTDRPSWWKWMRRPRSGEGCSPCVTMKLS